MSQFGIDTNPFSVPENLESMEHLRKGYLKYASLSEQFKNDSIALDHRKQVKDQLDTLNITLEQLAAQPKSEKNCMPNLALCLSSLNMLCSQVFQS